ncbi:MAG: hypothetical protein AAFY84_00815 [Pseudomonadota bacterium]
MLLRRITEHVKAQNWTAVCLDFAIVVIGVGVALVAGEWLNTRAVKADLQRAEVTIHREVYTNYLNALERMAIQDCNAIQIRQLADKLTNTDEPWVPVEPYPEAGDIEGALGGILRAPYRGWPTDAWKTASDSGLLIYMNPERRGALSDILTISEILSGHEDNIFKKQSELKALMIASELSASDRLRYYDILAEIDAASALMEVGAEYVIQGTESLEIALDPEFEATFLENVASRNRLGPQVYGDCFELMVLPGTEGAP